ncbi:hypothetical protein EDB92DRAFT_1966164 [Lactarius akahatsu]|uniref:Uncharacterized protein n=1 Tax=Lactarius akahatsu TaxID=416441 RepID=A0AAD4LTH7_9AGAM|nr:hypothetical protein EDB92DRAFT_1966164 [Lactarius akahatsu]
MDLVRMATSGCRWTDNELDAYNIDFTYQDAATFFGPGELPLPQVDNELLDTLDAGNMLIQTNAQLINYLDQAIDSGAHESAADDFAMALLQSLGYATHFRLICTRVVLPLNICGRSTSARANPNVCILDRAESDMICLIQENKPGGRDQIEPRAQLIAEAIAAFNYNNLKRTEMGQEITLLDKVYYKVRIT